MTSSDCRLWLLHNLMVFHVLLIIVYCTPLTSMADTENRGKASNIKYKNVLQTLLSLPFVALL